MPASLESISSAHSGSATGSTHSWSHTLGELGPTGLIVVGGTGKENTGQHDPEEIQNITFNGVSMTKINDVNRNESGFSLYELHGLAVPPPGTYTITITYKGVGTPDAKKGFGMAFRGVKNQAAEATGSNGQGSGNMSATITTVTPQALLVGMYGTRTGSGYTNPSGQTIAIDVANSGGENTGCVGFYQIIPVPGLQTISFNPTNSEDEAIIIASFVTEITGAGIVAIL